MAKIISTFFGIGFIKKGGGTVAAVVTCFIWYLIATNYDAGKYNILLQSAVIAVLFIVGVWSGNVVEKFWGKDSYRVVLDEVLGQCIALFMIPLKWQTILAALILFRFFDISKILFVKRMENFRGGWGVMLDDVLAGIYAALLLHLIIFFRWL